MVMDVNKFKIILKSSNFSVFHIFAGGSVYKISITDKALIAESPLIDTFGTFGGASSMRISVP